MRRELGLVLRLWEFSLLIYGTSRAGIFPGRMSEAFSLYAPLLCSSKDEVRFSGRT